MSGSEAAVAFGPVRFEIDGLDCVGESVGVVAERGVSGGAVGEEDVVGWG